MASFYLRHPDASVVGHAERCAFVRPGREPLVLEPRDPAKMSVALRALSAPCSIEAVERLLELKDLLVLVASGFILQDDDPARLEARRGGVTSAKRCGRVTLGITGAVGAIGAPALATALDRHFAGRVDVVLTEAASKMVRSEAFAYLGIETWTDAFAPRGAVNVPHMFLAAADLVVVAPASANTLHKLATGACSDLLALVVAATRAPVVVAPSMNVTMWDNPAIARNVALLRERGFHVVEPSVGFEVSERDAPVWSFGGANLDPATWFPLLDAVLASPKTETRLR